MKIQGYLTATKLGTILQAIGNQYGFAETIKTEVRVGETRRRWDYQYTYEGTTYNVEFDGDKHYWDSLTIMGDDIKNSVADRLEQEVIRIPYFVQLNTETIKHYFGLEFELETDFPQGFITTKIFPASFCSQGKSKYHSQKDNLPLKTQNDLIASLAVQSEKYGAKYVY
jgi:hypothetical protein